METQGLIVLVTVLVMSYFFLSNRVPVDRTALCGLLVLVLLNCIPADEAFDGLGSPAVVTMLAMFIVGGGLKKTGVTDKIAKSFYRLFGKSEVATLIGVMLFSALLSSFMNNVAATVVLLPAVIAISHRADIPPSQLLIPFSFGIVLGGTTTLIGTTPNILIAEMMREEGVKPFGFFDFAPFGIAMVIVGILYMVFAGRFLLPKRSPKTPKPGVGGDLPRLYRLHERLFTIKVPKRSVLDGKTLAEARFGGSLGAQVVAVIREGSRHLAPNSQFLLQGNDQIVLRGKQKEMELLFRFRGIEAQNCDIESSVRVAAAKYRIESLQGRQTLREIAGADFEGIEIIGIERNGREFHRDVLNRNVSEQDQFIAIGPADDLRKLGELQHLSLVEFSEQSGELLENKLFLLNIPKNSRIHGLNIEESRLRRLLGVTLVGIVRAGSVQYGITGEEIIRSDDQLLVTGDYEETRWLLQLGGLTVYGRESQSILESGDIGVVEVVLSPRSKLIGKSLIEIDFREKYGFQVLALWRGGRPRRTRIGSIPLELGDALLIQGPKRKLHLIKEDPDFVVLTEVATDEVKEQKGIIAVVAMALVILVAGMGALPVHIASFLGAMVAVLGGAITLDESYREVQWKLLFLIAALIPVGKALETTGVATLAAAQVVENAGSFGPFAILVVVSILSSALSQALDGSVTVVLLTPIVLKTAESLAMNPYPLLMALAISTSISFLTPFSHKANLLVMGAGGYRVRDYLRVGSGLTVLILLTLWVVTVMVYPLEVTN